MSILKSGLIGFALVFVLLLPAVFAHADPLSTDSPAPEWVLPSLAQPAASSGTVSTGPVQAKNDVMQWGGDDSTLNRKTHIVELIGNAYVIRDAEVLHADKIRFNTVTHFVHAEGRVHYRYTDYLIRADAIDVDMRTKTGTIYNGNISNGAFALRGSQIDQVAPQHFLVKDFNYSTCYDCPNSWDLSGNHADVTIGDYIFIKDFIFKVKDSSFVWLPYMLVPIKTKRQSGLLFPRFGTSQLAGWYFVEPYFIAVNDWSDMTVGVGDYTSRGARFEAEGRYAITERSLGVMNLYWTHDEEVKNLYFRYAIKGTFSQELPYNIDAKLNLNEVSDSAYPITYSEDITGRYLPVLSSDLSFSRNDPELSTVLSFRRIRNLLQFDPNDKTKGISGFDGNTVQEFPRLVVNSNDHFIFGQKLAFGVDTRFSRFVRAVPPIDYITVPGTPTNTTDPTIREANRFNFTPGIYTTLNPWHWLSVVPSIQYHAFAYNFNGAYDNLARGYLLGQVESSFQLEKSYSTADPDITYKHTIRPTFTYSNIPNQYTSNEGHPFLTQQKRASPGQYFDNYDIIPFKTSQNLDSYFIPLGDSLSYGFVTQLFKRVKQADGSNQVQRRLEGGVTQTFDIYQASLPAGDPGNDKRIILSPLFSHLLFEDGQFSTYSEYTYYSFLDRYDPLQTHTILYPSPHRFSTTASWTFESATRDNVLSFNRSIYTNFSVSKLTSHVASLQLGGTFSINDYVMPRGSVSYNLVKGQEKVLGTQGSILFQSPSKCWQIELGLAHSVDQGSSLIFNYALNLTGSAFESNVVDQQLKK